MIEMELEIEETYKNHKFLFTEKTYCSNGTKLGDLLIKSREYLNKIEGVISISFCFNGKSYLIKNKEKEI